MRRFWRESGAFAGRPEILVIVTNEIFSEAVVYEGETETYQKYLGTDQPETCQVWQIRLWKWYMEFRCITNRNFPRWISVKYIR